MRSTYQFKSASDALRSRIAVDWDRAVARFSTLVMGTARLAQAFATPHWTLTLVLLMETLLNDESMDIVRK